MTLQFPLDVIAGDTVGIWSVSHRTSALGQPIVLADLSVGYSCVIKAVNAVGVTVVAERAVVTRSVDNRNFLAALNPSETSGLAPGKVIVAIQLTNLSLTPPLRKESHYELRILPSLNTNT